MRLLRGLVAAFAAAATISQHQSPESLCQEIGVKARAEHEFLIPPEGPRASFVNDCHAITRTLTKKEAAEMREVFGDSIDYEKIRVHSAGYLPFSRKMSAPNGDIFAGGFYAHDLTGNGCDCIVHEGAHIWQYQNGVLNPVISAIVEQYNWSFDYQSSYHYVLDPKNDLTDYGLEQQAQIIEESHALEKRGDYPANGLNIAKSAAEYKELFGQVLRSFRADPSYARADRAARPQRPSAG